MSAESKPTEERRKIENRYIICFVSNIPRTIQVIKTWIKAHFYDFENDRELLGTLQNFISNTVAPHSPNAGESLKRTLNKQLHHERRLSDSRNDSFQSFNSKITNLLDVDPIVLANQMTLIVFDVFV